MLTVKTNRQTVTVTFESNGTEHAYIFKRDGTELWPEYMKQGGETYRTHLSDVPDFVKEAIENRLNLKLVQR